MFNFEQSLTQESIRDIIREETRSFFNTYVNPTFARILTRLDHIEKNYAKSPVEMLWEENEIFFSRITPILEHIRDFEQKLYEALKNGKKLK